VFFLHIALLTLRIAEAVSSGGVEKEEKVIIMR
jgi:hypothetical protein